LHSDEGKIVITDGYLIVVKGKVLDAEESLPDFDDVTSGQTMGHSLINNVSLKFV
jgi:hypothetical protein